MSPSAPSGYFSLISFPRVSGDEPEIEYSLDPTALFSPRERG